MLRNLIYFWIYDRHDITEILLKVALNTVTLTPCFTRKLRRYWLPVLLGSLEGIDLCLWYLQSVVLCPFGRRSYISDIFIVYIDGNLLKCFDYKIES
jgi:hypothetical protein